MSTPAASADLETADRLARIEILTPISVVVPTYKEVLNIPLVIDRIAAIRDEHGIEIELIFMDDNSNDGSVEAVKAAGRDWARIVVRTENRGLSPAVVDGMREASHPVVVCMDCDLSHPPEKIPDLVLALESGQQFAIGSRYVPGGTTDDDWGVFRWLNSYVATMLARPLTSAKDPMSGYFAMRKADFDNARHLNPIGYKIALELIVKCGIENVGEVPIHFSDRVHGESKLSLKEQLKYIQHLRRLYIHKFGTAMDLLQFLVVGASGVVVNLGVLTASAAMGAAEPVALAAGVGVSVITNFLLNRRFTFSYARAGNPWKQLAGFVGASAVGMVVNFTVALALRSTLLQDVPYGLQLAAVVGIGCGMLFNFLGNRFIVFKKRYPGSAHPKPQDAPADGAS